MNIYLKAAVETLAFVAGLLLLIFGLKALGELHPGILASLLGIIFVVVVYKNNLDDLK